MFKKIISVMKSKSTAKIASKIIVGTAVLAVAVPVLAGGLDAGTEAATDFKTWFFSFLGVVAFIYLMIVGLQAWFDKKTWIEFGVAGCKVAVLGGALGLVTYLWGIFA